MVTVIVGMLLALLLALGVVALVAIPARRQGREVLTPQGEQLVSSARERVFEARERVVDLGQRLPTPLRSTEPAGAARPAQEPPAAADQEPPAPHTQDVDLRSRSSQDARTQE